MPAKNATTQYYQVHYSDTWLLDAVIEAFLSFLHLVRKQTLDLGPELIVDQGAVLGGAPRPHRDPDSTQGTGQAGLLNILLEAGIAQGVLAWHGDWFHHYAHAYWTHAVLYCQCHYELSLLTEKKS